MSRVPTRPMPATATRADTPGDADGLAREIAARAATIAERLAACPPEAADGPAADEAGRHLDAWKAAAAAGRDDLFDVILARHGTSRARAAVALTRAPDGIADWARAAAEVLDQLAAAAADGTPPAGDRAVRPDEPPFAALYRPIVEEARRRRDAHVGERALARFAPEALADLDAALAMRIAGICVRALNDAFAARLHAAGPLGFAIHPFGGDGGDGEARAAAFMREMGAGGFGELLRQRPVLARLVATVRTQWIAATTELIERIDRDADGALRALLGAAPGPVARLAPGLSDPHAGGRSVVRVAFEDGVRVAYKPKDLRVDLAFAALLRWLEARGAPRSGAVAPTVACAGYGWSRWVDPEPATDERAARRYFASAGALIALAGALGSNDFHFENLVAVGDRPVLVDLETILHPPRPVDPPRQPVDALYRAAEDRLLDSVQTTGLLPGWLRVPGGDVLGFGGLDDVIDPAASDGEARADGPAPANLPRLDGRGLSVRDHPDALLEGYRAMSAFLAERAGALAAPDGPLEAFRGLPIRALMRPTQLYAAIHHRSLGRRATGDGIAWSAHHDLLCRASEGREGPTRMAALVPHERRALARADIPFFATVADGRDIRACDGAVIPGFFPQSALDRARARLRRLDGASRAFDETVIAHALARPAAPSAPPRADGPRLPAGRLLAVARELAERMRAGAYATAAGTAWYGRVPVGRTAGREQFGLLDGGFMTGTLGIAAFLAALWRVTGEAAYAVEARRALCWTETLATDAPAGPLPRPGLWNGEGGLVYGLAWVGLLLGAPEYGALARRLAARIEPEAEEARADPGLEAGLSGLVLALAALGPDAAGGGRLARTLDLLEARLDRAGAAAAGPARWPPSGPAGIALALVRARAALPGRPGLSERIRELGATGPARDPGAGAAASDADAGMPEEAAALEGTCLARLAAHAGAIVPAGDVATPLARLADAPVPDRDMLVGGAAGRAALLLEGARILGEPRFAARGHALLAERVERAARAGGFRWSAGGEDSNPGFAGGAAGLGLVLLRAVAPDEIPPFALLPTVETP